MTRLQLALIAVLSLASTGLVLVAGASGGGDADVAALVADRRPVTVGGAPAADDGGTGAASDAADVAEGGAPDEVGTFDGGGAAESAPVAEAPVEEAPAEEAPAEEPPAAEPPAEEEPQPTKIRHVFVISLAGHGFDATFGAGSAATYLNGTLRPKGVLLDGWRSLGSAGLPDLIATVGGQPPNADTRAGCPTFREIPPTARPTRAGELTTDGCVYPNTVATLGDQLTSRGLPWRAYVEDLDRGPDGVRACRRPASNAADDTLRGRPGDGYATRLNPFVYFHSLLDLGDCDAKVGGIGTLESDLRAVRSTPALSWIAPNLCNSGAEAPCVDGSPGGLAAADAFLATWVPRILASPAYGADGLLVVAFAGSAAPADPAAAADAPVRNGALLVSRFAQAGGTAGGDYDPYSLLRSVEDLFALRPLARAAAARSFAPTVLGRAFVVAPSDG